MSETKLSSQYYLIEAVKQLNEAKQAEKLSLDTYAALLHPLEQALSREREREQERELIEAEYPYTITTTQRVGERFDPLVLARFHRYQERLYHQVLERCFLATPQMVLESLVDEVRKLEIAVDESGTWFEHEDGSEAKRPYDELMEALLAILPHIWTLRTHQHEYPRPEDHQPSRCMICGRSGDI